MHTLNETGLTSTTTPSPQKGGIETSNPKKGSISPQPLKCLSKPSSPPKSGPALSTCKCGPRPKFKNLLSHFGLPHQMLSEMVCLDPVAATRKKGKGLCAGQVLTGVDRALVLPTQ